MVRYETLVLTVPEITSDESKNVEKEITSLVEKNKGTLISYERWGKYRLAYPVKKNEYGVYFLARFETEDASSLPKDVALMCKVKFSVIVMRDMTTRLDESATLVYQRPPSLEDAPTRDVKTFLRDNKMESLIPSVEDKAASQKVDETVEEFEMDSALQEASTSSDEE